MKNLVSTANVVTFCFTFLRWKKNFKIKILEAEILIVWEMFRKKRIIENKKRKFKQWCEVSSSKKRLRLQINVFPSILPTNCKKNINLLQRILKNYILVDLKEKPELKEDSIENNRVNWYFKMEA